MAQQQTAPATENPYIARMLPNGTLEVRDRRTNQIIPGARLPTEGETASGVTGAVIPGQEGDEVIRETPEEVIYRRGPFRTVYRYDKATQENQVWDLQELIPEDVKRPFAGAVSSFIDTPGEGYLPAGLPATASFPYQLYNLAARNSALPEFQNDFLDRQTELAVGADQSLRDALGITPPETPLDYGLEIFGSLIMPAPKLGAVSRILGRTQPVNSAGRGLNFLGRTNIPGVQGRSGGLLQGIVDTAGELALPLRQGNLVPALATQIPLGVGVAEVVDSAENTDNYTGIADAIDQATTYQPTVYDGIPDELLELVENEPDVNVQLEMLEAIMAATKDGTIVAPEPTPPSWRNPGTVALAGLGVFAGGAVGLRLATQGARQARRSSTELSGRRPLMNGTSLTSRIMGGIAQSDQVLRDVIRNSGGSEDTVNRLTRNTPQASDVIIGRVINTGQFPNSSVSMQSPAATLEALGKDLAEDEWNILSDGLLARTALDDRARVGVATSLADLDDAALGQRVAAMQANPRVAAYADQLTTAYRRSLDYMLEQGYISQTAFDDMVRDMPNYVPLRRSGQTEQTGSRLFGGATSEYRGDTQLANLLERTEVEGAGVKTGDALDPIRGLPDYITNVVRNVEQNTMRVELMDIMLGNPEVSRSIKMVPIGESSVDPRAVTIRRDGVQEIYLVDDPAIRAALQFSSRLGQNVLMDVVSLPTRLTQAALTGPLAPFFQSVVSPAYDMTLGTALRPRGYDLGLLSEAANNLIPNLDDIPWPGGRPGGMAKDTLRVVGDRLKALDPTVLITPVTGAARLGWDSLIQAQALSLTEQLIRQDGLLYRALGQQGTRALRDRLAAAYEASYKSQMEEVGATSSGLMLSESVGQGIGALTNTAPNFYARASRRAMDEAIDGNPELISSLLQQTNQVVNRIGSAAPVRAYMSLMRILGEGFRYQAFATNAARAGRSAEAAQEVGNQTRRLSSDVFQRGASEPINQGNRVVLYGNVGVQSLAQVGRQLKDQPITTALNTATFIGLAAALQYALAADPDTQEYIRTLTPEQQAGRIVLAPDVYVPVANELRTLWGPLAISMNDLSGLSAGTYNENYAAAFNEMLEGQPLSEGSALDSRTAFDASLKQSNPYANILASVPLLGAAASSMGFDPGMSAYANEPSEIRAQGVSGFGGEGQLANDNLLGVDVSATTMAVIEELMTGVTTNFLRSAMDVQRALDEDVDTEQAIEIGLSRFTDQSGRRAGPLRGVLFQDQVFERSSNTANSRLYFAKVDGIDRLEQIYNLDYSNQSFTSQQDTAQARPNEQERVNVFGTQLQPILEITHDMSNDLSEIRSRISGLNKAISDVRNQTRTTIEERNTAVNEYREEVEDLTEQALFVVQDTEEAIQQLIGDPTFTFQTVDPERYRARPFQPQME